MYVNFPDMRSNFKSRLSIRHSPPILWGGDVIDKQNPMQNNKLENTQNRRVFPRITAQCPVMHRPDHYQRWSVGLLINFSATGMLFTSARELEAGADIIVKLERGRNMVIPALSGSGKVIRCRKLDTNKYEVACQLNKINPPT